MKKPIHPTSAQSDPTRPKAPPLQQKSVRDLKSGSAMPVPQWQPSKSTVPPVKSVVDAITAIGRAHEPPRDGRGSFVPASFKFMVRPHDIAGAVVQLQQNGSEGCWIVFLFDTAQESEKTNDKSLALQYSVIDGHVGLDWVLLGPRNIADSSDIAGFMRDRGHLVERRDVNGVEFLRIEDWGLAGLGESILEMFYRVRDDAELGLLINGIYLSTGKRTNF